MALRFFNLWIYLLPCLPTLGIAQLSVPGSVQGHATGGRSSVVEDVISDLLCGFDFSSTTDSTGNYTVSLAFNATIASGGLELDGDNDSAACDFNTSVLGSEFTVAFHARLDNIPNGVIAIAYLISNANFGFAQYTLGSRAYGTTYRALSTTGNGISANGVVHHIAVVQTTSNIKTYVDGSLVITDTSSYTATDNTFFIGIRPGSNDQEWEGGIDNFEIYDRALDISEIVTLSGRSHDL